MPCALCTIINSFTLNHRLQYAAPGHWTSHIRCKSKQESTADTDELYIHTAFSFGFSNDRTKERLRKRKKGYRVFCDVFKQYCYERCLIYCYENRNTHATNSSSRIIPNLHLVAFLMMSYLMKELDMHSYGEMDSNGDHVIRVSDAVKLMDRFTERMRDVKVLKRFYYAREVSLLAPNRFKELIKVITDRGRKKIMLNKIETLKKDHHIDFSFINTFVKRTYAGYLDYINSNHIVLPSNSISPVYIEPEQLIASYQHQAAPAIFSLKNLYFISIHDPNERNNLNVFNANRLNIENTNRIGSVYFLDRITGINARLRLSYEENEETSEVLIHKEKMWLFTKSKNNVGMDDQSLFELKDNIGGKPIDEVSRYLKNLGWLEGPHANHRIVQLWREREREGHRHRNRVEYSHISRGVCQAPDYLTQPITQEKINVIYHAIDTEKVNNQTMSKLIKALDKIPNPRSQQ